MSRRSPSSSRSARVILSTQRKSVALLATTSLIGGVLEALFLVLVTRTAFAITDGDDRVNLVAGRSVTTWEILGILLVLVALRVAAAAAATWQSARLSALVVVELRERLGGAFLRSTWELQHDERSGRLQELLTTFTQQGAQMVYSTTQAITAGFSLVALLVSAIIIDPVASIAVIAVVAVLATVLRPLRAAVRRQAASTAHTGMEYATSLNEIAQLGMEMHVFNVQPQTELRVSSLIRDNAAATRRLRFLQGMVPAVYTGLAYLAIIGGLAVVAGIDASNITSVGTVMLVMLRSLSYGQGLQTASATINSSLPFLDSLHDELERFTNARVSDGGGVVGHVGELELADVSFEYEAEAPVLDSVRLSITDNEVVGIVGPSGSGKSTLVQLLLALRDPTSGRVLADGRDVRELSRSEWARKVTFVPQQAHLIAGTIADNIRFLRDDVTQTMIEEAARLANLHADIEGFADGYERQVGERGSHLSGGQQQRLIIARALVENPDVLILDEPTSALDVRSEHLIRETLNTLREKMTIIIVAHRLSTLEICDRIMVIQDGALKGFDTPENLERTNDFYREALILSGMR